MLTNEDTGVKGTTMECGRGNVVVVEDFCDDTSFWIGCCRLMLFLAEKAEKGGRQTNNNTTTRYERCMMSLTMARKKRCKARESF